MFGYGNNYDIRSLLAGRKVSVIPKYYLQRATYGLSPFSLTIHETPCKVFQFIYFLLKGGEIDDIHP